MTDPHQPILILGASGFIGSHLTRALLSEGTRVRAFSRRFDRVEVSKLKPTELIEIHEASVFDEPALMKALNDVSTVVNLLTFSVPNTSPTNLQGEISTTFQATNMLLSAMVKSGAKTLVFPSSGGTIYGDVGPRAASEDDPLAPLNSHGLGKLICEDMIHFYSRVHGLKYLILRISNPYGAARIRRVSQGVIDVFLEQIHAGQPLSIWGSIDVVRDFIFIDDLMDVFLKLLRRDFSESQTLNVGSGNGTTLRQVIDTIEHATKVTPTLSSSDGKFAGVIHSLLNIEKLVGLIEWAPIFNIETGIAEAWRRKQRSH